MIKKMTMALAFIGSFALSFAAQAEVWYVKADVPWEWTKESGREPGPVYFTGIVPSHPEHTGKITMHIEPRNRVNAEFTGYHRGGYHNTCQFKGIKTSNAAANGTFFCTGSQRGGWSAQISPDKAAS
jgi:hypothetical protein